jgi:hypothetical protein
LGYQISKRLTFHRVGNRKYALLPMAADWVSAALPYVGGGVLGASVTYGLTWVRERRRTLDSYRAPQRAAIGDIITAVHGLALAEFDMRTFLTELIKQSHGASHYPVSDVQLMGASTAMSRALLDVERTFRVGSLTIVDAPCWEAMNVAYSEFRRIRSAFADMSESADNLARIVAEIRKSAEQLNRDVMELVRTAQDRVSPVQDPLNKERRRRARLRLRARYPAAADDPRITPQP